MLDEHYPQAIKFQLVMNNLNTHHIAFLYETFEAAKAKHLTERLEIHYTPKHGSWLNMAEIESSASKGQCLDHRLKDIAIMQAEVTAWQNELKQCDENH